MGVTRSLSATLLAAPLLLAVRVDAAAALAEAAWLPLADAELEAHECRGAAACLAELSATYSQLLSALLLGLRGLLVRGRVLPSARPAERWGGPAPRIWPQALDFAVLAALSATARVFAREG